MNKIIFPLKLEMKGEAIADLQDSLLLLLDQGGIQLSAAERKAHEEELRAERTQNTYGQATAKLVALFQTQNQLQTGGAVNKPTAIALNAALERLGAFNSAAPDQPRLVSGQVQREDGLPFRGRLMRANHEAEDGAIRLGEDTTDAEGRYAIRYQMLPGVTNIQLRVSAIGKDGKPLKSSELIRDAKPLEVVNLTVPITGKPAAQRRVEGRVVLEYGLPAEKVKLRLYRHDFGKAETLIGETTTREGGLYALPYDIGGKAASLEVRAVDGAGKETPLSKTMHDLGEAERTLVNLVAPTTLQPLAAEYQRLTADLKPHVGEIKKLAEARENAERQDLTLLNRATGWDARLIALAANAEKLSADGTVGLSAEVLYSLFRAGLPSDRRQLARVSVEALELALAKAREAGIVNLSDQQVANAKKKFEAFALETRLAEPAPGSRSTYGELLNAAGLNANERTKFASVYLNHRGSAAQLWEKAAAAGIAPNRIQALQRQGKLAFLTRNSTELTNRLQQGLGISDPVELVEKGFYQPEKWKTEIKALAGNNEQKLKALIPPAYEAEKVEDRLSAYAEDMARKVRLSYPTQVVGHRVEQDAVDEFKLGAARQAAAKLLKNAAAKGFRLGQTPVETFVNDHPEVLAGIGANARERAKHGLKTLQRVYQITPSYEAMPILMSLGLTSAYDVTALSQEAFLDRYGHKFPSREQAILVYRKAEQVSSVTYNLFTIAKKLEGETPVYGMSAPVEVREAVKNELIKQFPTLQSLFGSMDFCECEHCRSVLSPAAYLVNLLQFIDAEPQEWTNFLADWKEKHNGQDYTARYQKPYDAIVERRPDLPHIPLTCENTNTALPYIDVVNEILEYYVAHGRIEDKAAHDTGDATTAELLAEPQNVVAEAYDKLQQARYPLTLPFDLWLETVRRFCDHFETPLWRLLEAFRPGDELFAPTQAYDRENIFIESLRLSPAEYAIFTHPDPLKDDNWHELYGYTTARPVIGNPTNTTDATVAILKADAEMFKIGDLCTYFDVSANALHTETKAISAIGAEDSGGVGKTTITFTGTWNAAPVAGDRLVFDAPSSLKSAKALSRRLGMTYKELVEIIQTGFVNPKLAGLVLLYKLGVTIQDVLFYREHKAFYEQNKDLLVKERSELSAADQQRFDALSPDDWQKLNKVHALAQRLKDLGDEFKAPPAQLESEFQAIPFDAILVLADPDAGCDFDLTTLRYASGKAADNIAFLKINLFVRLWRKLGWSIEEIDRALQAFVPKNTPFDAAHLAQSPLKTALIYLAHLKALDGQVRVGKQGRLKLITLWSDLATTGKKPLYAQLFLTRSALKSDPVFDDALGQYLSPSGLAAMAQSRKHAVRLENVAPANKIDPAPFTGRPKITLSYDSIQEVQHLTYEGVLTDADKAQLSALSTSPALPKLLNAVQVKAREFTQLKGHLLALQGALGLTADEIGLILSDVGKSINNAELSLAHVSLLYRYGLLAKALKLSVRDLIALKHLSVLDPFKPLSDNPLTKIAADHPFTQTLRFIEVAGRIKESGLKIEDLDYLLRHRFDQTGKYRLDNETTLALMKTLAEGVRAIRAEHAVPEDAGVLSEDVLRQKLGLILPPDVVERFLAMMNGTVEFTAIKTGVQPAKQLKPEGFAGEPTVRQVSYNAIRQEQLLTFRGVLFNPEKNDLKARLPKPVPPNPHTPSPVLGALLDDVQAQALSFFVKHLQKQAPNVPPTTGFLDPADFDLLFARAQAGLNEAQQQQRVRQQRTRLVQAFLPFLQQRLIRQFIIQTMTAQTSADPPLVESLLTDARLLSDPQPLLEAFTGTSELGLTATFFASTDGTGAPLATLVLADADTGLKDKDGRPLKPAGANSARLEGYLEVPAPGAYRFYVVLDKKDAEAEISFSDGSRLLPKRVATSDRFESGGGPDDYIELEARVSYRFTLKLGKLNSGEARLLVQGETLPKDGLAQLTLSPLSAVERGERALILLGKALQLIQSLSNYLKTQEFM